MPSERRRSAQRAPWRPSTLRPSRDYRTYDGDPFLANARLKVEGGSLVAIDSLGEVHRFPLNGEPTAPAVIAHIVDLTPSARLSSDLSALAVFDGEGKALLTAPHDAFHPMGADIFARRARLRYELRNIKTAEEWREELERRRGCVELRALPPVSMPAVVVYSVAVVIAVTLVVLAKSAWLSWWLVLAWPVVVLLGRAAWKRHSPGEARVIPPEDP